MAAPLPTFTFAVELPLVTEVKAANVVAANEVNDRACAQVLSAVRDTAKAAAPSVTLSVGSDEDILAPLDDAGGPVPHRTGTYSLYGHIPLQAAVCAPDAVTARRRYQRVRARVLSVLRAEFATANPGMWFYVGPEPARLTRVNGSTAFTKCEDCPLGEEPGYVVDGRCTRDDCPGYCINEWCRGKMGGGSEDKKCGDCADRRYSHEEDDREARQRHAASDPGSCPVCRNET
ncbi:hypothetical protein OG413_44965 [Streptomyces sp. NBC_01433]|uniref:hypothetical protein n=1 Tax=Streptomyces sp. NBC_01433 TaxID=2903864 RepID=UPI00224E27B8|nr:hypothetical protein [Streptomyces sp. NBC_01433]MCX4682338.1 hypothetical protein [Streptomyces sp. NBC_01433]